MSRKKTKMERLEQSERNNPRSESTKRMQKQFARQVLPKQAKYMRRGKR